MNRKRQWKEMSKNEEEEKCMDSNKREKLDGTQRSKFPKRWIQIKRQRTQNEDEEDKTKKNGRPQFRRMQRKNKTNEKKNVNQN